MTTVGTTGNDAGDGPLADLEAAATERERLRDRVEDVGESRLEAVASAYRNFARLLERHEDSATGYGDFQEYVAFQEELDGFVDGLGDDLPARDAFETADDVLQKRRLSGADFERAREALAPAGDLAELSDDWEAARERYRAARGAVSRRIRELDRDISDLRHVLALGAADLDAPVERLRRPIEGYNDAVRAAFSEFQREASARDVFAFMEATGAYPLVEFRQPPARLREFVESADAGEEPIPTLLEYAEYSKSKLSHYVERPNDLKRHVATNRTYLERLDATPLTVAWPPPPASRVWWRTRELVAVVGRFAREDVVAKCREVQRLARNPEEYGRLREAAHAIADLQPDERERLQAGEVRADLERAREERDRLQEALDEYPER